MTISEARKILGAEFKNLTDEEILEDIETAEMFESMFFNIITNKDDKTSKMGG